MAGLVLVVLLVILAEDWSSHRISQRRLSGIDCTKMEQTVTVGGDGSYRWGGFLQKGKAIRGSDPFAGCKACVKYPPPMCLNTGSPADGTVYEDV